MSRITALIFESGFYLRYGLFEIVLGLGICWLAGRFHLPILFSFGVGCATCALGLYRVFRWLTCRGEIADLSEPSFSAVTTTWLDEQAEKPANAKDGLIYVGKGYVWENRHTQRYQQLLALPDLGRFVGLEGPAGGRPYMHNLGVADEKDLWFPLDELKHSVIAGTTGVGKTRFIELLTYQIIQRGETLIIVDPKGDADLLDSIHAACVAAGREQDFVYFSLAHPSKSATINPVGSWLKSGDISSRITSIMPQEGSSRPFTDFCNMVLTTTADLLIGMGRPINLKNIHRYSLVNSEELLTEGRNLQRTLTGAQRAYVDKALELFEHEIVKHPKEHFSKMSTSLGPVMTALATGEIGELLSPDKPTITWESVTGGRKVVYFYLASMIDAFTSSSVGKLVVQDFLSYIGQVYAFKRDYPPVNLFVDEFYSVMYPGYVDLLNKARGAGVRVFLALQTTADITSVTDMAMTKQILGNINNKFYLRVPEIELAKEFAGLFGLIKVGKRTRTRSVSADPKSADELFTSGFGERLDDTDVDLISPEMVMGLPKGQAWVYTQGRNPYKIRMPLLTRNVDVPSFTRTMVNPEILPESFLAGWTSWVDEMDEEAENVGG